MSEYPVQSMMPRLARPVTRERIRAARESGDGASLAVVEYLLPMYSIPFADDDAE